jgi:hypothetical protein
MKLSKLDSLLYHCCKSAMSAFALDHLMFVVALIGFVDRWWNVHAQPGLGNLIDGRTGVDCDPSVLPGAGL